ncbi:MAG TPA: ABC transporter permease [Bryobacteraceae bacterium]|nr:ABC transporter permease [Bryobacteraceae bacterium]
MPSFFALKDLWRRLHWIVTQSRFHSELADEIQFHIESRAAELEQQGVSQPNALAAAQREFGSRMKAAEDTASVWQFRWLHDLSSDLIYAGRAFRRNPGFALTAVGCLALGIGANTTIFSITTSFLFSEPSCRDTESLIAIWEGGNSASPLSDYKFLRDANVFEGVAGINVEREINWRDGERTSRLYSGVVTDDYFTTLGIPLLLGRGIAPHETNTVVLSERVWRRAFASDPAILGRTMILDGSIYTVAGVVPANHRSIVGFALSPDIYVPVDRDDEYVQFYARAPKGMTHSAARARIATVFARLDHLAPKNGWKRSERVRVTGITGLEVLNQMIPGPISAFFVMLMVVVGLVLLIACANVASLLLARASSRSQELAIRLSLGASRQRIVRHLLAESLLLAILGCMVGLMINYVCSAWLSNVTLPVPAPIHFVIQPDHRLLLYCLAVVLVTALVSGLMPALKAVKRDVSYTLKQDERQTTRIWNLRSTLVAGQLAVSIVLLATAFLFVHNLLRATSMNPGFDVQGTLWAYMRLVPGNYKGPSHERQMALVRTGLERLRALPGVRSAAITARVPLNDNCVIGSQLRTDVSPDLTSVQYECNSVGPDYFRTLSIPILRGREFTEADRRGAQSVVVVNESFARRVFGNVDPVGHTFKLPNQENKLIVGVAKDSKYFTLSETQRLAVYETYSAPKESVNLSFLLRTAGVPANYVKPVTDILAGLDSTAAIETRPMSSALGLALLPSRAGAAMLGTAGLLALVLAAIGLHGALLYSVSRRTREIGVRMALGATPAKVLRLIGGQSLILVGGGTVAGLILSLLATQPLALFLVPGMSALDPAAFLGMIAVLIAVGILAIVAPAARAMRIDPMNALRYE